MQRQRATPARDRRGARNPFDGCSDRPRVPRAALGQRAPSLPTLWRLHVAHVLPLEHYLEKGCACADAVVAGAVEAFRRGVLELGEGELGAGISDEVMILPGMFRELLAIVHTGSHFGTAETGRRQPRGKSVL